MYFFDSDTCIEFLRGNLPQVYKLLKQSDPELFGIPCIVEAELYFGAENSRHPQKSRLVVDQFLSVFKRIEFDSICASHYAILRSYLKDQGTPIGPNDMLIAATALAHGATLITNNVREFQRIPGLRIESWAEIPFTS